MDTTPSTITVKAITVSCGVATFSGLDESGVLWAFRLNIPFGGGGYWFVSTASDVLAREGSVDFTSRYDNALDRWYVYLGNYGIPSERFYEWAQL